MIGRAFGQYTRRIRHGNFSRAGGGHVNVVEANAKVRDDFQIGAGVEQFRVNAIQNVAEQRGAAFHAGNNFRPGCNAIFRI